MIKTVIELLNELNKYKPNQLIQVMAYSIRPGDEGPVRITGLELDENHDTVIIELE